jgi:eukaryotic-like serine/threonine-protein kinase
MLPAHYYDLTIMLHTEVVLAGRFRLDRRIGSGDIGEVWRAVDLSVGAPVAVKVLRSESGWPPETLTRFRAEARHASSVSHPGIARVYYYDDGDPPVPPYLVTELVMGPSLARVLASGPLDPARAMDVIGQAAAALSAAHEAGLVHGDIKPANLIIAQGGEVKITDFGIAAAASTALAHTGAMAGPPDYLAPECVAGLPATWASDLYSLGVVGYECLAGQPPFDGPPVEVATAHRHYPLPPLPDSVPDSVATFVAKLTAKDPRDRPTSADQASWWAMQLRDSMASGPGVLPRSWQAGAGMAAAAVADRGPAPGPGGFAPGPGRPAPGARGPAGRRPGPGRMAGAMPPPARTGPAGATPGYLPRAGYAEPPPGFYPPVSDTGPGTLARIEPAAVTGVGPVMPIDLTRADGYQPVPYPRDGYSRPPYPRTERRVELYRHRARKRSKLAVLLASAAAAIAVLIVMLAMGALRGSPAKPAAATPPRARTHARVQHTVLVTASALVGHPAAAVRSELRKLGLKPHLVKSVTTAQAAGLVVSIQPGGKLPLGSVVTVTEAVAPAPPPPAPTPTPAPTPSPTHGGGGGGGGGGGDN